MGFTVAESVLFPSLGVSIAGCYVTIKGTYVHGKKGIDIFPLSSISNPEQKEYVLSARFYVYSSSVNAELVPLREAIISYCSDELPADPFDCLYSLIKTTYFDGLTITDDL
jgi:hypothetical protein